MGLLLDRPSQNPQLGRSAGRSDEFVGRKTGRWCMDFIWFMDRNLSCMVLYEAVDTKKPKWQGYVTPSLEFGAGG